VRVKPFAVSVPVDGSEPAEQRGLDVHIAMASPSSASASTTAVASFVVAS